MIVRGWRRIDNLLTLERADLQPHFDAIFHAVNEWTHRTCREAAIHGSLPAFWRARRHRKDMGAIKCQWLGSANPTPRQSDRILDSVHFSCNLIITITQIIHHIIKYTLALPYPKMPWPLEISSTLRPPLHIDTCIRDRV
jgi:hypothetical protein